MSFIEKLSRKMATNSDVLRKYINTCPYRYKVYKIPKRNGHGTRTIAQPAKELKFLQRFVCKHFLSELPIHDSSIGYMKGLGIKDNAEAHKNGSYLLKMDFNNFFPSINEESLEKHLKLHPLEHFVSEKDIYYLSRILFYKANYMSPLVLSIGAPSSPFVSNTIMYEFDKQASEISKQSKVVYTRYADDLAFSTNQKGALFKFRKAIDKLVNELNYPTLSFNEEKTLFLSKKGNRHITGLVIANDQSVSIGRSKKRYIKSLVYRWLNSSISDKDINYLIGYLAFCSSVDPNFIISLRKKYGNQNIDNLIRGLQDKL